MKLCEIFTKIPDAPSSKNKIKSIKKGEVVSQYTDQVGDNKVVTIFKLTPLEYCSNEMREYVKQNAPSKVDHEEIDKYRELYQQLGGSYEIIFSVNDEFEITGEGDAIAILNNVLSHIAHFVNTHQCAELSFTSEEDSRTKLYIRLVDRVCKLFNFKKASVDQDNYGAYFKIHNPKYIS